MAPFVPIANGAQVEIIYNLGGVNVENRLWFTFDNPPFTGTDLQGLADGVAAWHISELLPYLSSDITLAEVVASDWTTFPVSTFAINAPSLPGGISSKSYSANVSVRINLRWPLQFRERMNCNFLPGIPDDAIDINQVVPLYQSRYWNAYVDLIDAARLFTPFFNWRWVVASAIDAGSLRSSQLVGECIGPVAPRFLKVGQRRTRLR